MTKKNTVRVRPTVATAATFAASAEGAMMVSLQHLAANPDNPAARSAPADDLVASIAAKGVLTPLGVIPVAEFPAERDWGAARFVIVHGHRRAAAAAAAGLSEIPAVVVDLRGAHPTEVILHENLLREDLTVLEQAELFALMVSRGRKQADIAAELGISQGLVSKRLKIAAMPDSVKDILTQGAVEVSVLNEWTKTQLEILGELISGPDAGQHLREYDGALTLNRYSVDRRIREIEKQPALIKAAQEHAVKDGVEFVSSDALPQAAKTVGKWEKDKIAAAKEAGVLAWTTDEYDAVPVILDTAAVKGVRVSADAAAAQARKALREANAEREAFLVGLITKSPSRAVLNALYRDAIIGGLRFESTARSRAQKMIESAGIVIEGFPNTPEWDWLRPAASLPEKDQDFLAYVYILAANEQTERAEERSKPALGAWVMRLQEWGFIATGRNAEAAAAATKNGEKA